MNYKNTLLGIQADMSYGSLLKARCPFLDHTVPDVDAYRFEWTRTRTLRTCAYLVGSFAGVVTTVCAIACAVLS